MTSSTIRAMRSQQELEHLLDQYIGLLGDDWRLIRGFDDGDILYGAYASAEEAEHMIQIKWQGTASFECGGLICRDRGDQIH